MLINLKKKKTIQNYSKGKELLGISLTKHMQDLCPENHNMLIKEQRLNVNFTLYTNTDSDGSQTEM